MRRNPFSRKMTSSQSSPPRSLRSAHPPTSDQGFDGDTLQRTAERAGAKSTSPGGDADFALGSAPAGADPAPARGAGTEDGKEAERGPHQDKQPPVEPSEPTPDPAVHQAPTVNADVFMQHGVAANDVPAPVHADIAPGAERRRHLSEMLYRPRSGTKRTLQLTCSAEPAERAFIDLAARKAKRSRSAYLMDCALTFAHAYLSDRRPEGGAPLPSPQATQDLMVLFGKLVREFGRVGNNLNQLVRTVHQGELPDRAEDTLSELHQVAQRARLLLDQALAGGGRRGA